MSTFKYEYKLQGNGADSWIVSVIDDRNNVIDKYMFYGDINSIDPTNAIVIGKNQQHTLDVYKKIKKKTIDLNTENLLINGFLYNNYRFGLRENEKTKWLALFKAPISKYPITLVSKEGQALILTSITAENFYEAAFDRARLIEEQGGILKYQVNQCTTVAQVLAINDNRT